MIKVGTDCSGMESPIIALENLGISYLHEFSSEIDPYCRKTIKANFNPTTLYEDIFDRDHSTLPDVDLYITGFPCQPFSTAGKGKGFDDARGNIFSECVDVIKTKKPTYFILENVKGLLSHDKGETWNRVREELKRLEKLGYSISHKVLNTKDYGLPQNRERLYIVGDMTGKFRFDNLQIQDLPPLTDFIDTSDTKRAETSERHTRILEKLDKDAVFIEFAFGVSGKRTFVNAWEVCPCVTANTRIWCVPMHRYANVWELMWLQGLYPNPKKNLTRLPLKMGVNKSEQSERPKSDWKHVVSNTQAKKQIGNAMSVNILENILKNLIPL